MVGRFYEAPPGAPGAHVQRTVAPCAGSARQGVEQWHICATPPTQTPTGTRPQARTDIHTQKCTVLHISDTVSMAEAGALFGSGDLNFLTGGKSG